MEILLSSYKNKNQKTSLLRNFLKLSHSSSMSKKSEIVKGGMKTAPNKAS